LVDFDFKTGRPVIRTVKYADVLVLLAKEETVLKGAIDSLTDIGISYETEMNVETNKVMGISRKQSLVQKIIYKKHLANVDHFDYLSSMMQDVHGKLNPRLPCQSNIQQEADSLHQQIELKLREKTSKFLRLEHSFVLC
jgi:hypothetical protein